MNKFKKNNPSLSLGKLDFKEFKLSLEKKFCGSTSVSSNSSSLNRFNLKICYSRLFNPNLHKIYKVYLN